MLSVNRKRRFLDNNIPEQIFNEILRQAIEKGLVEEAILYADLSPAAEHSVPGGKGFPNTMKKDNTIRDMGDHAFAGKVVGFIAARNDALFGKLLDEAAGLLVMM